MGKFFGQNPYIGCFPSELFSDWKLESIEHFLGNSPMMMNLSYLGCLRRKSFLPINKSVTVTLHVDDIDSKSIDEKH